jgi:hypothetical protein
MPTLNWIGKDAVVKHHKDVPYRLLEPVAELSCEKVGAGDTAASGNLIVQGDNLHATSKLPNILKNKSMRWKKKLVVAYHRISGRLFLPDILTRERFIFFH